MSSILVGHIKRTDYDNGDQVGVPVYVSLTPEGKMLANDTAVYVSTKTDTKLSWEEIVSLVSEVSGCEFNRDPDQAIGHQMTGINFNSLARIIDKVMENK